MSSDVKRRIERLEGTAAQACTHDAGAERRRALIDADPEAVRLGGELASYIGASDTPPMTEYRARFGHHGARGRVADREASKLLIADPVARELVMSFAERVAELER